MEPPGAPLVARHRLDPADVGTAGLLGHELRALPHRGEIAREHARQQILLELRVGIPANEVDRRVGDADRAHDAELALHEQVLAGIFRHRVHGRIEAEHAGAVAHGVELEVAEGDRLHLAVGGVVLDPVLVAPQAVARVQHGPVLVGDAGKLVEAAAGEHAEARKVRRQMRVHAGRQVKRQQLLQPPVDGVEVLPRAVRRNGRRLGPGRGCRARLGRLGVHVHRGVLEWLGFVGQHTRSRRTSTPSTTYH